MNSRVRLNFSFVDSPAKAAQVRSATFGFSLIEMIGVLAIMAIIAGAVAPNVLKSIDRTAVSSEIATVGSFGDQVKKYLHDFGTVPAVATWNTQIGTYSGLSPADVLTNKRQNARVYILDTAGVPTPRALLLSSMRNGLGLPAVLNPAQFTLVWNTQDGQIPNAASWAGWAAWTAVANSGDYLIIQRVNLNSEYRSLILQNKSNVLPAAGPTPKTVSYKVISTSGGTAALGAVPNPGTIAAGVNLTLPALVQDERVLLYSDGTYTTLDYTYVVTTTGRTIDFTGSNWVAE